MKSKLAVCLFGIPRSFESNSGHLLSKFPECDIFAHFWIDNEDEAASYKQSLQRNHKNYTKTVCVEPLKDTRYHAYDSIQTTREQQEQDGLLRRFELGGLEEFGKCLSAPGWQVNPKNIVSMWNSMSKSVFLALSYASHEGYEYDRIILARTDVQFDKSFDVFDTFVGDVHRFLMPQYHPGSRISDWLPDHVISMSSKAAEMMTLLPQFSYHHFYARRVPIIPEIMLGYHMREAGMNILDNGLYYRSAYKFVGDNGKI